MTVWILKDILTEIRESFFFALLAAGLFLVFYVLAVRKREKSGHEGAARLWAVFFLAFYTAMILFRTLINREPWPDPLEKLMGGWGFWEGTPVAMAEAVENVLLLIPFIVLLFHSFGERLYGTGARWPDIVFSALKISFLFSLGIEVSQLVFRMGTLQVADLVYNTAGGMAGGIIFCLGRKGRETCL